MSREFNVAGPCIPDRHYMVTAAGRLPQAEELIKGEKYFVIHAARQSGKTTCLKDIVKRLNAQGHLYALYCSLEGLQGVKDAKEGIPEIVRTIRNTLIRGKYVGGKEFGLNADYENSTGVLQQTLTEYCESLDKPLVILFDEVDCLCEGTLISFLRQLRNGYIDRDVAPFPSSIALVGMRDIRDYSAQVRPDGESTGVASPFNISAKTLTLKNFTVEEIAGLYAQHSADTNQVFEEGVTDLVHQQTDGQPWLVNAIAREVIEEMLLNDFSIPVTPQHVLQAIQRIILNRPVHLDSLLERLKEPRVRRIIEPLILGDTGIDRSDDDFLYVRDLGLIKEGERKRLEPGNPIYAEVIARFLSSQPQMALSVENSPAQSSKFIHDGIVDMDSLLHDFRNFWRENSDIWEEKLTYKESAPHLVLFAFLQRVINGGGQIIREMATGKGRVDINVVYQGHNYPIELKICRQREKLDTIIAQGLEQTARYMDSLGSKKAHLLIFDNHAGLSWEQRLWTRTHTTPSSAHITILGS